jgi:hypothetical protein
MLKFPNHLYFPDMLRNLQRLISKRRKQSENKKTFQYYQGKKVPGASVTFKADVSVGHVYRWFLHLVYGEKWNYRKTSEKHDA